jgi:hypothetical protein
VLGANVVDLVVDVARLHQQRQRSGGVLFRLGPRLDIGRQPDGVGANDGANRLVELVLFRCQVQQLIEGTLLSVRRWGKGNDTKDPPRAPRSGPSLW